MTDRSRPQLALCFFISGATTLALEVVWSKELSYILGNTHYAVATVVAAFMTGLALGSALAGRYGARIRHPIRAYAWMEFAIAACGVGSIWVLRSTPPLFATLYSTIGASHLAFLGARFLLVFLLLLIPVTLMGMTLPVVVGATSRGKRYFDYDSGLFYGLNTLGAVAGSLIAGFYLMPAFGLARACGVIGLADLGVGIAAIILHRRSLRSPDGKASPPEELDPASGRRHLTSNQRAVAGVFLLSGFCALVYEIAWFRFLVSVLGPSVHAFAMMLAVFLAGIGLGSSLGTGLTRRIGLARAVLAMAVLEMCIGLGALLAVPFYDLLPELYVRLFVEVAGSRPALSYLLVQGLITAIVVLPGTLAMGLTFPIAVRAFLASARDRELPEVTVGKLYLYNTLGAIAGSLTAGFYLVPTLGFHHTILSVSLGSVGLGCFLVAACTESTRPYWKTRWIAGSLVMAVGIAILAPPPDVAKLSSGWWYKMSSRTRARQILYGPRRDRGSDQAPIYYRDGVNSAVSVLPDPSGSIALMVSNKPVATSELQDRVHLYLIGHLPALLASQLRDVALVGLGGGVTAGAVLKHPTVESVDIVEIEAGVVEASRYFAGISGDPLGDARARLIVEDGRTFLTYTDRKYDLISADPISPISAGAANLYTADYFALVAARLKPRGVFSQWIPMSDMGEASFRSILAAISSAFPHNLVFLDAYDAIVVSSPDPFDISWDEFRRRFDEPAVREDFASFRINTPHAVLAFLYAGPRTVRDYVARAPVVNTDDNVWLERRMPIDLYTSAGHSVASDLVARWASSRLDAVFGLMGDLPVSELVQTLTGPSDLNRHRPLFIGRWMTDWYLPTYRALTRRYDQRGDENMLADMKAWQQELLQALRDLRAEKQRLNVDLTGKQGTHGLARLYALAGHRAERAGDLVGAEQYYRRSMAIPRAGTHYETALKLAALLEQQGRLDEALAELQQLTTYYPVRPAAYARIQRIHRDAGNAHAAEETRAAALMFVPRATAEELTPAHE